MLWYKVRHLPCQPRALGATSSCIEITMSPQDTLYQLILQLHMMLCALCSCLEVRKQHASSNACMLLVVTMAEMGGAAGNGEYPSNKAKSRTRYAL